MPMQSDGQIGNLLKNTQADFRKCKSLLSEKQA